MKLKQLCIICGSPAFAENMCEKCFLERKELFAAPETIFIKQCTSCGRYYDREWTENSLEDILKGKISSGNRLIKLKAGTAGGHAILTASGYIRPSRKMKTEMKRAALLIKKQKCADCIKLLSGYYQAVFQIRGPRSDAILKKTLSLASEGITVETAKNGYDVRFVDKKRAASISRYFREDIKKSYKLITEKKGKKLYRDFYSIR